MSYLETKQSRDERRAHSLPFETIRQTIGVYTDKQEICFSQSSFRRINNFVENLQSWNKIALWLLSFWGPSCRCKATMHVGTPGGGTLITRFSKTSLGIALMV